MAEETTIANQTGADADTETRPLPPKPKHPMEALLRSAGNGSFPKLGELAEATVLEKKGTRVFVDLGAKGAGIIYGKEYYAAENIIKTLNPGDVIHAKITDLDNEDGYIELSLKEAGEEKRWVRIKHLLQSGQAIDLPVLEANRGGLILELEGIKGFLPASQLSGKNYPRVDNGDKEKIYLELQKLVGAPIKVKVLDANPQEEKVIFSEKGVSSDETRATLAKYKTGDTVEGEITGVVDFGAFVRFGETLEGLIHISEIDWSLIEDPRSLLKPGDKVLAKIIDIQGDKVALSLKALKEDPWLGVGEKYRKGNIIKGIVTKFNPFGAFVAVEPHIQGLVHISEFGNEQKMREELALNSSYDFRVMLVEPREHRMALGMARHAPPAIAATAPSAEAEPLPESSPEQN